MNSIQLFLQLEKQKKLHCDTCVMICWINTPGEGIKTVVKNWNTVLPKIPRHQKKYNSLLQGACVNYASNGKN